MDSKNIAGIFSSNSSEGESAISPSHNGEEDSALHWQEAIKLWGCQIEWFNVNYEEKGEGSQLVFVSRATSSTHNASPSDFPMNTSPDEPKVTPNKHSLACSLEHLTWLVFEVHRNMTNLKFRVEMLNQCISWLVALHASKALKRPTS
jgi:hypothetical protein